MSCYFKHLRTAQIPPASTRISKQSQECPANPDLEAPGDVPDTSAAHAQNNAGNTDIELHELLECVLKAHLSLRARNMVLGNITSLRELAGLDFRSLLAYRNCGRITAREIMTLIEKLRESNPSLMPAPTQQEMLSDLRLRIQRNKAMPKKALKSALALPPSEETLNLLPFFLNSRLSFISEDDLHPGFKANTDVGELFISVRSGNVLRKVGYERLGQILLTPRREFLKQHDFGWLSLIQLDNVVHSFILNEPDSNGDSQLDDSSFSKMVCSLVTKLKLQKRDQEMILMWLLPEENAPVSYQTLADRHSLSKARIEQIINKAFRGLRHPAHARRLRPFWNRVSGIIDSEGRAITLEELARAITHEFQWDTAPHPASVKKLISKCGPEELIDRLKMPKRKRIQPPCISYL